MRPRSKISSEGWSQYRLQATQAELERISRESIARRPGLLGAVKDKPAAVALADAAAAIGAGFDVDTNQQEAMVIAQVQQEEEDAERREAERYIEEEEENLLADIGERVPAGGMLETRRVSSDLVVSINKRSEYVLEGNSGGGNSTGTKRSRDATVAAAPVNLTSEVMMFVDSDDD